ncbi:MAG: hypothetical protein HQL34_10885 [Alphaproteobacteria bacterium]|nr:hypothetical protein [Alphaproteobacteria bacterium]
MTLSAPSGRPKGRNMKFRHALRAIVTVCATLAAGMVSAQAGNSAKGQRPEEAVADLLFQESASWKRLDDFPSFTPTELDAAHVENLWSSVESAAFFKNSFGCNFGIRLFFSDGAASFFKKVKTSDGKFSHTLYSGPDHCSEEEISILWPHNKTNVERSSGTILRIDANSSYRFIAFNEGCCGSIVDDYISGRFMPYAEEIVYVVPNGLYLPKNASVKWQDMTFPGAISLSRAPEEPGDDGDLPKLSSFPAGVRATRIAEQTDGKSDPWFLVFVRSGLDPKKTPTFEVGWVRAQ